MVKSRDLEVLIKVMKRLNNEEKKKCLPDPLKELVICDFVSKVG